MISLPQQLLNQNPNNYSHRLEQHKNSLVDFFKLHWSRGKSIILCTKGYSCLLVSFYLSGFLNVKEIQALEVQIIL